MKASVFTIAISTLFQFTSLAADWGLHTADYKGSGYMQAFWTDTPFHYTGFYLAHTPYEDNTTWTASGTATRDTLVNMGWGVLALYEGYALGSHSVNYAEGVNEAKNASELAKNCGFPQFSYIYLALEVPDNYTGDYLAYINGWCDEMESSDTPYWPGIYCSFKYAAPSIHDSRSRDLNVRYWTWWLNDTYNNSTTPDGMTAPDPTICGDYYTTICHVSANHWKTYNGYTLYIDVDTAVNYK